MQKNVWYVQFRKICDICCDHKVAVNWHAWLALYMDFVCFLYDLCDDIGAVCEVSTFPYIPSI